MQSGRNQSDYGGKDLWKRWVLSGMKGRGSDRRWERRWWLWQGDTCRMRWTRKRVNRMRLMEWRRELIPQVRWCISARAVGDWWHSKLWLINAKVKLCRYLVHEFGSPVRVDSCERQELSWSFRLTFRPISDLILCSCLAVLISCCHGRCQLWGTHYRTERSVNISRHWSNRLWWTWDPGERSVISWLSLIHWDPLRCLCAFVVWLYIMNTQKDMEILGKHNAATVRLGVVSPQFGGKGGRRGLDMGAE